MIEKCDKAIQIFIESDEARKYSLKYNTVLLLGWNPQKTVCLSCIFIKELYEKM